MKKYKHGKNTSERTGFYVALSVCLIAVGLAVWSAYTTVSDYTDASDDGYFASLSAETLAQVAQDVTGVTEENDATEATEQTTATKRITIYETLPATELIQPSSEPEREEETELKSRLSSLQAVLKVSDSLIYPVKSQSVLKQYSENAVYNKTMKDYRAHTGCDFDAEKGEPVYAMCSGTVENISSSELYGIIVEVDCSEFSVFYCGLDPELSVSKGDSVTAGDTIGAVSSVPCESSDESHIHIEIKVGDKLIDPLSVIKSND